MFDDDEDEDETDTLFNSLSKPAAGVTPTAAKPEVSIGLGIFSKNNLNLHKSNYPKMKKVGNHKMKALDILNFSIST